ncbi:N-acetylglucosamine kinase [Microbulbifer thermotolerans]|uniref:ATPase n=1 Tax=Microbulbifer thermotolerans TaxID=252514 RepID=A0A143HKI9_MICTH|nr:BadF/BadG/BcrA/BcrD ATPase family protein [Microbulbifer thermotolerans]AMX01980.1 ATPase [Microbulbifer thermotolerans]MCX2780544.1 ATPase [Microbulbifer thermotolerans]MCX2783159.1 ATPase [Microbulbifer thermotolerans]MCX2794239.1 ATPase [Microbulbifer thermotolerans]MCX2800739.1 ATPase [Microbulbifer thermotolerans]
MVAIRDRDIFFIGIDGGGSKCRASIVDANNQVLGTGVAGPANPLHGYAQTIDSIVRSAALALADADLPAQMLGELVAGAGLAGVNMPRLYSEMAAWAHPFSKLYLTTDQHTACLGAHRGGDGAVIIVGTGSCGYVWANGQSKLIGGHGFPHGDKGSGAWMGMEAVKYLLMALDGLAEDSRLKNELLQMLGAEDANEVFEKIGGKSSSHYARLAVPVIECAEAGDPVAEAIVRDGASYISDLADKLLELKPPRLSMIGGLAQRLRPWLAPHVVERLATPLEAPEMGCVYFARQSLAKEAGGGVDHPGTDSKAFYS